MKSCTVFVAQANGASVTTIEGVAGADGTLHALQDAFREHHGLQCGFCTPGMIVRARRLLEENPNPSEEDIRYGISGNLCPLHGVPEHRQGDPRGRGSSRRGTGGGAMSEQVESKAARAEKLEGLGCARKRVEDVRFTQGKGNYVDDVKLPGMLFGDFVRSPYAHAPHQVDRRRGGARSARRPRRC